MMQTSFFKASFTPGPETIGTEGRIKEIRLELTMIFKITASFNIFFSPS